MTLTFDSYIGIAGIILAALLYYFDLKKNLEALKEKLQEVLNNKEGILTKQQAHDLIDLYLDAVDSHIEISVTRYASNDLPDHYSKNNIIAIHNEFERAYDQIVKKSIRKMVSSFRLRGQHRVDELITNISQDRVTSAMTDIANLFASSRQSDTPIAEVIPKVLLLSRRINAAGKALIVEAVDKFYPSTADER